MIVTIQTKRKSIDVDAQIGTPINELAQELLQPTHIAAVCNDELLDLFAPLTETMQSLRLVTTEDPQGLYVMRHSTAHLMAQAIKRLHPTAQVTIGPVVDNGFYYDIAYEQAFTPDDLRAIEAEMEKCKQEKNPVVRTDVPAEEAKQYFSGIGEHYKCEIVDDIIGQETVSLYQQGDFTDLCRGPHVPHTGLIGNFKLTSVAGAYWRADASNQQLQRIYGVAFADKKQLKAYVKQQEEAKARDHRKLGKELELFFFDDLSPSSPFFLPNGTTVYNLLVEWIRSLYIKYDYQEVITPQVFDVELWKRSGHWDHYKDNMYLARVGDEKSDEQAREFGVKPMNCPGHTLVYSNTLRSYRDLPLRIADFGRLHRYELSGVTQGLTRVRSFCQDDAHVFCRPDQIGDEIEAIIEMIKEVYDFLEFAEPHIALSTRPAKSMGDIETWDQAEATLRKVLDASGLPWKENPGDGAFYGPKIDFQFNDAIGRAWQLATVQLDFQLPDRFELNYVDENDGRSQPVMIHRAVLGSVERFMGVLIEHYAGSFPYWLAPIQIMTIPIGEAQIDYAKSITDKLVDNGVRCKLDGRNDTLRSKIRNAQLKKIPYMLILGQDELEQGTISLRAKNGEQTNGLSFDELLATLSGLPSPKIRS